jgi:hypothetical protein
MAESLIADGRNYMGWHTFCRFGKWNIPCAGGRYGITQ